MKAKSKKTVIALYALPDDIKIRKTNVNKPTMKMLLCSLYSIY